MRQMLTILGVFVLLGSMPSWGKEFTLAEVLSGKTVPLTLTFKDMNSEWKRFTTGQQRTSPSDYILMSMMIYEIGGEHISPPEPAIYTHGDIIQCGRETYLIAYQRDMKGADVASMMAKMMRERHRDDVPVEEEDSEDAPPTLVTLDTPLNLCLLNLQKTGDLLNIAPYDPEKEVSALNKQGFAAQRNQSLNNLRQLAQLAMMHAQENDEMLPTWKEDGKITDLFEVSASVARQPQTRELYCYNTALSGVGLGDIDEPDAALLFYEPTPAADGSRCVCFVDGQTKVLSVEEWEAQKKKWALE